MKTSDTYADSSTSISRIRSGIADSLHRPLHTPGNQTQHRESQDPIETGLVHVLNSIQARPNFREIVSTTNDYSQTLAHLAILFDYPSLLRHLVDWSIDLAIPDVNGLTALHYAYMKGNLHNVRILQRGGAPEAAKDKLGRIPSDLQSEGFGSGFDISAEAHLPGSDNDGQVVLGRQFRAFHLDEDKDSRYQSDSEDGAYDAKEPVGIAIDSFADGDEGGSDTITTKTLKKGIIKSSKNKANVPQTILLLGETGGGKTSFLKFIANVLSGNDTDHYDFNIIDRSNEQRRLYHQSQTTSVRLYEITSTNGVVVRIIDTPGFTDTRYSQEGALQNESIAAQIKGHIDSITVILFLTNGVVPGCTHGLRYTLSTLSTIFPQSPTSNVAFLLTGVSNPLYQNFLLYDVPDALEDAPQFLIQNPVVFQKKYLKLKDDPDIKRIGTEMHTCVKATEQNALEMLVEFFDWLGSLEQQPIQRADSLEQQSIQGLDSLETTADTASGLSV